MATQWEAAKSDHGVVTVFFNDFGMATKKSVEINGWILCPLEAGNKACFAERKFKETYI